MLTPGMELLAIVAMTAAGLSSHLLLVAALLSLPLQYLPSRIRPSPAAVRPLPGLTIAALLPTVAFLSICAAALLWLATHPRQPNILMNGILAPLSIFALALVGTLGNAVVSAYGTYRWLQARRGVATTGPPAE